MNTLARTEEEALNGKPVTGAVIWNGKFMGHVAKEDKSTLADVANRFGLDGGEVRIKGNVDGERFQYVVDLTEPEPDPQPQPQSTSTVGDEAVQQRVQALQMEISRLENERDLLQDRLDHYKRQTKKARQEADEEFERRRKEKKELQDTIDDLREELSKTKGDSSWGKELGQVLVEQGLPQFTALLQQMNQPQRKQLQERSTVDTPTTPQKNGHAPDMNERTEVQPQQQAEQSQPTEEEVIQDEKAKILAAATHTARGDWDMNTYRARLDREFEALENQLGIDIMEVMSGEDWMQIAVSLVRGVVGDVGGDRLAKVVYPIAQHWESYLPMLKAMSPEKAAEQLVNLAGVENATEAEISLLADTLTGLQNLSNQSA